MPGFQGEPAQWQGQGIMSAPNRSFPLGTSRPPACNCFFRSRTAKRIQSRQLRSAPGNAFRPGVPVISRSGTVWAGVAAPEHESQPQSFSLNGKQRRKRGFSRRPLWTESLDEGCIAPNQCAWSRKTENILAVGCHDRADATADILNQPGFRPASLGRIADI
jgi:hypothetical protein